MEYELIDTGVFDDDGYFDVEVEHAKAGPEDIYCRITVHNCASNDAPIHLLPTLWFQNTWSWLQDEPKPRLVAVDAPHPVVRAEHSELGVLHLRAERGVCVALPRERNECRSRVGQRKLDPLPEGRRRGLRRARGGHHQSRRRGHEGRRAHLSRGACGFEGRTGFGRSRARISRSRTRSQSAASSIAFNTSPPNRAAGCSAATPTGVVPSGFRSTCCSSARCSSSTATTATNSRSGVRPARER
jgi:hypothetical protein